MADRYDFGNLSPIEFEGLCIDLLDAETGLRFERFSEGADRGIDGRHARADGDIILQAKHYKGSTWEDLKTAARKEAAKIAALDPAQYYFLTSQPLTVDRKDTLVDLLDHKSVTASRIWGRTELNARIAAHPQVEKRNVKLWLTSAAVLHRMLMNDISVQTAAYTDDIDRILKVFVANPSLQEAGKILAESHCLIISGPPGVGKTTLSQVIAADHIEEGYELVAIGSVEEGLRAFDADRSQIFVFDDFLGKIQLDPARLAQEDNKIVRFMGMIRRADAKRFILTTRAYIWQSAVTVSEAFDDRRVRLSEIVLHLSSYTRELKARILYNHLYHADIDRRAIEALLEGPTVRRIVDHPNYMPRIIEWMTDATGEQGIEPQDYPDHFIANLDRPDRIWEKAFRHHITEPARLLLYCAFFSEPIGWSNAAVSIEGLRPFFERCMVRFGVVAPVGLRAVMFEDTLREVKSSFVVIDGDRLSFINPSVQDFLSGDAMDATVIRTVAASVPRWRTAAVLWKAVRLNASPQVKREVASTLLELVVAGELEGRMPVHELADLVGGLVLATGHTEACSRLRRSSKLPVYFTLENKLPALIEALLDGRYRGLPHARAFGRLLRLQLHLYLAEEREYAFELEELGELARNLSAARVEMSDAFIELFDEAVAEALEPMRVDTIPRHDDPEQLIGEWLEQLDMVEGYSPTVTTAEKRREFDARLRELSWAEQMRMEEEEAFGGHRGHAKGDSHSQVRSRSLTSFSDSDLGAMFSSLRRRE